MDQNYNMQIGRCGVRIYRLCSYTGHTGPIRNLLQLRKWLCAELVNWLALACLLFAALAEITLGYLLPALISYTHARVPASEALPAGNQA